MRRTVFAILVLLVSTVGADEINPSIDMDEHLRMSVEAAAHREQRRIPEDEFIRMAAEPGTIVLDARSRARYDELHVAGAVNLSFPDFTADALAALIPDRSTRILIYCNNNFINAEGPFPTKAPAASLNLSTFAALYTYGYRNVYELAPLLDIHESSIEFKGSSKDLPTTE